MTSLASLANNFLHSSGWMQSLELNRCVNQHGDFIPWYNYPSIRFLEERLTKDVSVFEFGAGWSTLFYAKRCKDVTSVEQKEEWLGTISAEMTKNNIANATIILQKHNISQAIINQPRNFDIVAIDSQERASCAKNAVNKISDNGVIILDNSERPKYKECFTMLHDLGFKHITFCGIGPLRDAESSTSFFYRSQNILQI